MKDSLSRRDAIRRGVAGLSLLAVPGGSGLASDQPDRPADPPRPFLTPGDEFRDVSRGNPIPHTLEGEALVQARLTPDTWRLEVAAEGKAAVARPLRIEDGTALDFPGLLELGRTRGVKFLKAMQCNNIAQPLGQGLWEGVPLRDVLRAPER